MIQYHHKNSGVSKTDVLDFPERYCPLLSTGAAVPLGMAPMPMGSTPIPFSISFPRFWQWRMWSSLRFKHRGELDWELSESAIFTGAVFQYFSICSIWPSRCGMLTPWRPGYAGISHISKSSGGNGIDTISSNRVDSEGGSSKPHRFRISRHSVRSSCTFSNAAEFCRHWMKARISGYECRSRWWPLADSVVRCS